MEIIDSRTSQVLVAYARGATDTQWSLVTDGRRDATANLWAAFAHLATHLEGDALTTIAFGSDMDAQQAQSTAPWVAMVRSDGIFSVAVATPTKPLDAVHRNVQEFVSGLALASAKKDRRHLLKLLKFTEMPKIL